MTKDKTYNPDERFHFRIWHGKSEAFRARSPSLQYCENYNADLDYSLTAFDFELTLELLIERQRSEPHLGNWTGPITHLVRQVIELRLKGLLQAIEWHSGSPALSFTFTHDLAELWKAGRDWLFENDYSITKDSRLGNSDRLIENLHAIDPTGDLFRFGTSRKMAFGRNKSSDRVGYEQESFFREYLDTKECLSHWAGIITREVIDRESAIEAKRTT